MLCTCYFVVVRSKASPPLCHFPVIILKTKKTKMTNNKHTLQKAKNIQQQRQQQQQK